MYMLPTGVMLFFCVLLVPTVVVAGLYPLVKRAVKDALREHAAEQEKPPRREEP